MLLRTIAFIFTFLFVTFPTLTTAWALSTDWQGDNEARARFITARDRLDSPKLMAGLEVQLGPEWHTYWRSPGLAGFPPEITWNAPSPSSNLVTATLLFPAPHRSSAYGLDTIGYKDRVLYPIELQIKDINHPLLLETKVTILVCKEQCMPKHFTFSLTLPAADNAVDHASEAVMESAESSLLTAAMANLPVMADSATAPWHVTDMKVTDKTVRLTLSPRTPEDEMVTAGLDMFVENDAGLTFSPPTMETENKAGHPITLSATTSDALPEGKTLHDIPLTLTLVAADKAMEVHWITTRNMTASGSSPVSVKDTPPLSLLMAILLALVGGFTLNLMPCVLPVLSLKVLSVIGHGGGETRAVRRSFVYTGLGIMFSFLLLGITTLGLREAGLAFGWGIQFQQPWFLIFLIVLISLFAANLWDVFTINLPTVLANTLGKAAYHPKLAGDFATGALATLLATPCSAPFLGTAIGFALSSGTLEIIAIFMALGLGMVLPYGLIALFPQLATRLPRPGKWMNRLRHMLGLFLAFTALWLLWVLAALIPPLWATTLGIGLALAIYVMAWHRSHRHRWWVGAGLTLCTAIMLVIITTRFITPPSSTPAIQWHSFDEAAITTAVGEGKTVFLDITADWCLTCHVNKKRIVDDTELSTLLFSSTIIPMQADWTKPDPTIAAFLKKNGRYGIPFNAVYSPRYPQGIILPELLTPEAVRSALDQSKN